MEVNYNSLTKWFDEYFATFNRSAGPLATAVKMKQFFADDLEFVPLNMAGAKPLNREGLLLTMIHPGLHEHLTPRQYVIDLQKMIVVAHFQVQFSDEPSGQVWPPKQASAHYYLAQDSRGDLKIKKIIYFMEQRPPEESNFRPLWAKYREKELAANPKLAAQLK